MSAAGRPKAARKAVASLSLPEGGATYWGEDEADYDEAYWEVLAEALSSEDEADYDEADWEEAEALAEAISSEAGCFVVAEHVIHLIRDARDADRLLRSWRAWPLRFSRPAPVPYRPHVRPRSASRPRSARLRRTRRTRAPCRSTDEPSSSHALVTPRRGGWSA